MKYEIDTKDKDTYFEVIKKLKESGKFHESSTLDFMIKQYPKDWFRYLIFNDEYSYGAYIGGNYDSYPNIYKLMSIEELYRKIGIIEYRELEIGEIIEKDDEMFDEGEGEWRFISKVYPTEIGLPFNNPYFKVRRPIAKTQGAKTMLKKGGFIIGSIHKRTGDMSFAKHPKVHDNFITAQNETERLAKVDQDKKFIIVEIKGICSVDNVVWE